MIDLEFGFWVNINNTIALAKTKMTSLFIPYLLIPIYIYYLRVYLCELVKVTESSGS